MKIEKVNDHQIRCTLTKADLADRELKISELAYGTEKAKNLFRDMMQQASFEFGFEAEDIPLMIEAIPLNSGIVLIITKVEDPEELDTRFSKFAPSIHEEDGSESTDDTIDDVMNQLSSGADDVLDLFKKIHEAKLSGNTKEGNMKAEEISESKLSKKQTDEAAATQRGNLTKVFSFPSMGQVVTVSHVLNGFYHADNSLYKNKQAGNYLLVINKGSHSPEEMNKVCNIISEYGSLERTTFATESFLEEHSSPLISTKAIQTLANF